MSRIATGIVSTTLAISTFIASAGENYALVLYSTAKEGDSVLRDNATIAKADLKKGGFKVSFLENPTKDEIRRKLKDLSEIVTSQDTFVFYAATHGLDLDGGAMFVDGEHISPDELKEAAKGIRGRRELYLFPMCHSGNFAGVASERGEYGITLTTSEETGSVRGIFGVGMGDIGTEVISYIQSHGDMSSTDQEFRRTLESFCQESSSAWGLEGTRVLQCEGTRTEFPRQEEGKEEWRKYAQEAKEIDNAMIKILDSNTEPIHKWSEKDRKMFYDLQEQHKRALIDLENSK